MKQTHTNYSYTRKFYNTNFLESRIEVGAPLTKETFITNIDAKETKNQSKYSLPYKKNFQISALKSKI